MLESLAITSREPVEGGRRFGAGGVYERISGRATFAVDPAHPRNGDIVDLTLAPRGADGRVRCVADFLLLRPLDAARANGTLLYNVVNRGNENALISLQSALPGEYGDGLLMNEGVTIAAVGWQADIRPGDGRFCLETPIARDGEQPITGPVRMEIVPDRAAASVALVRPDHAHYPPLDLGQADATLSVRDAPFDEPRLIPRERWRFAKAESAEARPSPNHVWLAGGFEAGRIYDVTYTAAEPRVVGLGFAATRDFVSFLRHDDADESGQPNPLWSGGCSTVARTIAYGASQSGRFLRHFLLQGFNEDEAGRQVFDGMLIHIAGAAIGSFNHRFAQPERRAHAYVNSLYQTETYPFHDEPLPDPHGGQTAGLLDRARAAGVRPKILSLNSADEYWACSASLTHTDPLGQCDVPLDDQSRAYMVAGTAHSPGVFPPAEAGYMMQIPYPTGALPNSPVPIRVVLRALFVALEAWLRDGAPPESVYPRIADGTLVSRDTVIAAFPPIPGAGAPPVLREPRLLAHGPRWPDGIADQEPPGVGPAYRPLVSAVDADGNDQGGVRLPEVAVPTATYTGWNYRHPDTGRPDAPVAFLGSYLPFPASRAEAEASGDPRLPLTERYAGKDAYLALVEQCLTDLVARRLLLPGDAAPARRRAEKQWDWVLSNQA